MGDMRLIRWAAAEIVGLAYQTELRGYCWACDALRWRWTHTRCARRTHRAGAEIAALLTKLEAPKAR